MAIASNDFYNTYYYRGLHQFLISSLVNTHARTDSTENNNLFRHFAGARDHNDTGH